MDGSLSTVMATAPLSWSVIVAVGALAGAVAAVVMDWPMSRQPDGFTPAAIAAGVLTRQSVDEVSMAQLLVVHHLAGLLAGVLYGLAVVGFTASLPAVVSVGGLDLLAHLLGVGLVVGFIYGFFAHSYCRGLAAGATKNRRLRSAASGSGRRSCSVRHWRYLSH